MKTNTSAKTALITGAGRRIGAAIAKYLHQQGMSVIIHYNASEATAKALCNELNAKRANSAHALQADLSDLSQVQSLAEQALNISGNIDVLVNNASCFHQTPVSTVTESQWNELFDTNIKAPFFLSQALAASLKAQQGCIVNIVDVHAEKPLKNYPVYSITKSAQQMLTYALAQELAPDVRVNGVSPGTVALPQGANKMDEYLEAEILSRNVMNREGSPEDIAKAVWFFIESAGYVTGQVLAVDGGRLLNC
jgi:pteridine reductase